MMISEQMDVAIINAIHYALAKGGEQKASTTKSNPLLDYTEFLLFRLTPQNFEETKKCFLRLPLAHMEESLASKMLETLSQLSVEQAFSLALLVKEIGRANLLLSLRFLDSFVRDFFGDKYDFSSAKQEKVTMAMFFAFLLKVELISGEQFLLFCRRLLSHAISVKSEDEKLFLIGLIAHSLESCPADMVKNYNLLTFLLEYSLLILDRKYVNMMLELQIVDVIHKIAPEINFPGLVKKKDVFPDYLVESQNMKKNMGEAKAYKWLQEKLQKVTAEPLTEPKKPEIQSPPQELPIKAPEAEKSEDIQYEEAKEEPEDPKEKNRLKRQFDDELEGLMAEGGDGLDQSQKKNVIFKQMRPEPAAEGFRLIIKNQKSRLVSRPLETTPIFDKKSSSQRGK